MNEPLTPIPQTTFTKSQLHRYLEHIEYPNPDVLPPPTLATLKELIIYHLARVPFENLIIHYSSHHTVSLDPQHLYRKIVERGHGGYCMENNACFSIMLVSLGFNLWTIGGKPSTTLDTDGVDREGGFRGWSHMVSMVAIDKQDYLIDVGFGNGLITPIPLIHEITAPGTGSQQFRLLNQPLKHQANRSLPFWILQTKHTSADPWLDIYAFCPNTEFSRADYEVMSYVTSRLENIIFAKMIVCIRSVLSTELSKEELAKMGEKEDGEVRVLGRIILTKREVKRIMGDVSEKLEIFETEEQRVQGFKKYFRLELNQEEQDGIRGRATEIRNYSTGNGGGFSTAL